MSSRSACQGGADGTQIHYVVPNVVGCHMENNLNRCRYRVRFLGLVVIPPYRIPIAGSWGGY